MHSKGYHINYDHYGQRLNYCDAWPLEIKVYQCLCVLELLRCGSPDSQPQNLTGRGAGVGGVDEPFQARRNRFRVLSAYL